MERRQTLLSSLLFPSRATDAVRIAESRTARTAFSNRDRHNQGLGTVRGSVVSVFGNGVAKINVPALSVSFSTWTPPEVTMFPFDKRNTRVSLRSSVSSFALTVLLPE